MPGPHSPHTSHCPPPSGPHRCFSSVLSPFQEHPVPAQQGLLLFCFLHVTYWKMSASSVPGPHPQGLPAACFTSPSKLCPWRSAFGPQPEQHCSWSPRPPYVIRPLRTQNSAEPLQGMGNGTQTSACSLTPMMRPSQESQEDPRTWQGELGKGISFRDPTLPPLHIPCSRSCGLLSPSSPLAPFPKAVLA